MIRRISDTIDKPQVSKDAARTFIWEPESARPDFLSVSCGNRRLENKALYLYVMIYSICKWSWNTPKAIYTVILLVSFQLPAISRTCFTSSLFSSRLVHRPSAPQSTDWLSTLSNRCVPALVSSSVVSDFYPTPAELIHSSLSYFDHLWNYLWIEGNLNLVVN